MLESRATTPIAAQPGSQSAALMNTTEGLTEAAESLANIPDTLTRSEQASPYQSQMMSHVPGIRWD